ncbi:hypothetical protein I5495_25465 [Citrobacter amalonaticus]|uniref:hypothetical protein n=1 Tax=Citrobacter amalonaticus TaxID=35703 RepID=UPI001907407F|nr:hypothetical protein [Citrobacter amalonaticus]MBJ9260679.1 hypothetical protein [Citrobacter amalonaticus]
MNEQLTGQENKVCGWASEDAKVYGPPPAKATSLGELAPEQLVAEQVAYEQDLSDRERARREEEQDIASETRCFVMAFAGALCLCFLIYIVL